MRPLSYLLLLAAGLAAGLAACRPAPPPATPGFTLLPPDSTGVTFVNEIVEDDGFNVLEYEYFYNGGGVAVGDVNGDGLPDLYFTANMRPDALYLNRGGFRFEDVTEAAGIRAEPTWTTGVTMADVNGDGHLDIYVCRSGRVGEERRRNALYLNNGDGTFSERAAAFGLDDPAYSTHATFFDADRDGDLDLFLLNHPIRRFAHFDVDLIRQQRDPLAGDKLYRNDGDVFVDVSEQAGIIQNPIGFGLSAQVSDLNGDGWPDLYVANDYIEDDYLYLNNGDGTFTEAIRAFLTHTSLSSMGTDIADVDNDGRPDIVTLDMLAEDPRRQHRLKGPEGFAYYRQLRERGFHEQYMRNMLHLNGPLPFVEIGLLAGIATTDWSWAPLLADFDLDGWKDLFVTNGYLRDYTDLDFLSTTLKQAQDLSRMRGQALSSKALVGQMPSTPIPNYLFRNTDGQRFEDVTAAWGVDQPGFSAGAAYADLDADGDLDLVVNNSNAPAALFRNEAQRTGRRWLRVRLLGEGGNTAGIGAAVTLTTPDGRTQHQEQIPARGYQSSVEPLLLFGVGAATQVTVAVTWPDGSFQRLEDVATNQTLTLRQAEALAPEPSPEPLPTPLFAPLPDARGLDFVHRENDLDDFEREPLLPHQLSRLGPALAVADVNRDGLDDVFFGGARDQPAALYFQQADGAFRRIPTPAFEAHARFEDVGALFFDADGDADLDLYVISGGAFADGEDAAYQDRLYLNGGFGAFTHAPEALPPITASGGAVAAHDVDGDGDLDLFVGGRVLPGRYPMPPRSYLLENTGGRFVDATPEPLRHPGLVTSVVWADLDGDATAELILAGEWMPIRVFRYDDGAFTEHTAAAGLSDTGGWWSALAALDLDADGDLDLVAGNRGLNGVLRATPDQPARIHAADFDRNGSVDAVISHVVHGLRYPVASRDELLAQQPRLAIRFPTYAAYADATLDDLLTPEERARALVLEAHTFASVVLENRGNATFQVHPLPVEAQLAPVRAILPGDLDGDRLPELLLAGNDFTVRPQWGRQQSGRGVLLRNRGGLDFAPMPPEQSGLWLPGDVRRVAAARTPAGPLLLAAYNDAAPVLLGPYRPAMAAR